MNQQQQSVIQRLEQIRERAPVICTPEEAFLKTLAEDTLSLINERDQEIEKLLEYIINGKGGRVIQNSDLIKAFGIIEEVIDTLIEVGNGTTDEMLHTEADKMFGLRYFMRMMFRPEYLEGSDQSDRKCWEAIR